MTPKVIMELQKQFLNMDQAAYEALMAAVDADDFAVQSHYTVAGGHEELAEKVSTAWRNYRRQHADNCCYGYVLSVRPEDVITYSHDWENGCYKYYKVPYSVSNGEVTLGAPVEVLVTMRVEDLPATEEAQAAPMTQAVAIAPDTEVVNQADVLADDMAVIQAAEDDAALAPVTSKPIFDDDVIVVQSEVVQAVGQKKYRRIKAVVTQADVKNSQNQVYPRAAWENNLPRLNRLAQNGKFFGQLEHPTPGARDAGERGGLTQTAILWEKFWWDADNPNLLLGQAKVLDTDPHGQNLNRLFEAGAQIDISSYGYGLVKETMWQGETVNLMDPDAFVCVRFDAVQHCSSPGSTVTETYVQSEPTSTQERTPTMDPIEAQPGATTTPPAEQAAVTPEATPAVAPAVTAVTQADPVADARAWGQAQADTQLFTQTRDALTSTAKLTLTEDGQRAYQAALARVPNGDLLALKAASDSILPILEQSMARPAAQEAAAAVTTMPHFYVAQGDAETAPRNPAEMIERLTRDLPDHYPNCEEVPKRAQTHLNSPRLAVARVMENIYKSVHGNFSGPAAMKQLIAIEQGRYDDAYAYGQSLQTGATTVAGDGAPISNYFIFPLVRRVYPQLIVNRIASIQPMDRPEGKIFYLDTYRTQDPSPGLDTRMDLGSSTPFNSSYADNDVEGASLDLVRLKLSSTTISAHTKKLGSAWSIEEMQDLRAYHNLDVREELLQSMGKEMALEWNNEVLTGMWDAATGGTRTFGKSAPATGFDNQKDWDEYLWVYIQAMSGDIFSERNGPLTHLVVGGDAALALGKTQRMTFSAPQDGAGNMQMYPGTTFFGTVRTPTGAQIEVFETNFWKSGSTAGKRIMGLRKGQEFGDTPYVFAPYADYLTDTFTDPADLTQKQGMLSRAGRTVVVSDAIAQIIVDTGTGVPL